MCKYKNNIKTLWREGTFKVVAIFSSVQTKCTDNNLSEILSAEHFKGVFTLRSFSPHLC